MNARKKPASKKPDARSALGNAIAAFELSEGPFYEGIRLLKVAQKDFDACAANKNLYSHALRALRHIASHPCEAGGPPPMPCIDHFKNQEDWCWPCFARDALRRGGDKA